VLGVPVRVERAHHEHLHPRGAGIGRGQRDRHAPVEPVDQHLPGRQLLALARIEVLRLGQRQRVGEALVELAHALRTRGRRQRREVLAQQLHRAGHEAAHVVVGDVAHRQRHDRLHRQRQQQHRQRQARGQPHERAADVPHGAKR
jgi:hypothetical protein